MKSSPVLFRAAIIPEVVVDVALDEEGLGICLSAGWDITVWCSFSLVMSGSEIDLQRISEIVGTRLLEFTREGNQERLVFTRGFEVVVHLDVRKASQLEAMMVRGPNNLIVVWND